jgi:hypothetical protein
MQFNLYDKTCSNYKTYGIILTPENSATPERQDDKFKKDSKVIQKANKKQGKEGVKEYTISRIKQGFMIETMLLPFLQVGSTCRLDFPMADAQGDKYSCSAAVGGSVRYLARHQAPPQIVIV